MGTDVPDARDAPLAARTAARADEELRQGRAAFDRREWRQAYLRLTAADAIVPLASLDLEWLAAAASLSGHDHASLELWARAYHHYSRQHDAARAARCAFWIALELLNVGEKAQAGGWLVRAQHLLDEQHGDCAERGLLLVLTARLDAMRGDLATASATAVAAAALAARFDDPDLKAFGSLIVAQMHASNGRPTSALALFDEIMVAVTGGEVSPVAVGTVYCAVIDGCHSLADVERAREWTAALSRWCSAQPELVRFRGQCLVHRAEILRLSGEWTEALREAGELCASRAEDRPAPRSPVGAAFYELAEIHRVRGDFPEAEKAYRRTAQWGRSPEPGFALLRLAQGRVQAAAASIRRVIGEQLTGLARARALAAAVEILIAVRDLGAARRAAGELQQLADATRTRLLRALSSQATGNVLLSEGNAQAALAELRSAWMAWQDLEAPYEAARVRVLLALACRMLEDHDAAELELEAARGVFQRLAATPEIARVQALLQARAPMSAQRLTTRELQVIRLIAGGKTNRAIARQLAISERTVDRHVANILRKLDVPTRSAATAYAYDHDLV